MKGLVTKLSSSSPSSTNSNSVVEDVKSKFAAIPNTTLSTKRDNAKETKETHAPITSIVMLDNGFLVTACRSDKYIKLWRIVESSSDDDATPKEDEEKESDDITSEKYDDSKGSNSSNNSSNQKGHTTHKIEYIRKFKGHMSGIIDIIKFDTRGRFLSTSVDKSVKLWELDCTAPNSGSSVEVDSWGPNLLANFVNLDKRWIKVS
jgi:hypothetical protein